MFTLNSFAGRLNRGRNFGKSELRSPRLAWSPSRSGGMRETVIFQLLIGIHEAARSRRSTPERAWSRGAGNSRRRERLSCRLWKSTRRCGLPSSGNRIATLDKS
jgi:hypothetical protein